MREKDRETEREMSIFALEEVTDKIKTEILHLKVLMDYSPQDLLKDATEKTTNKRPPSLT